MNRVNQVAMITIALGAMAVAQAAPAPAPPAPPAKPAKPSSYLGVDIRAVTHDRMAALKVKEARGVEVTLVDRDAPAGKAGLKEHDVILSFNGRNIQGTDDLRKLIRETPPGQAVELGISRDGQSMTLKAELADRRKVAMDHPHTIVIPRMNIRLREMDLPRITVLQYYRRSGVMVENLTSQLGEVFGVKNGQGVLVRSVDKDSAGEAAGVRAGDVIVRVANEPVADTSDWNRLMREQKPGPVQLGIMRDKRQQTLSLTVPERAREQSFVLHGMEDFDIEDYKDEMLELHRLQPEIERSIREAQEKVQRELERSRRELERSQRDSVRAQRDSERARRDAEREAARAQREAERERERALREAERAQEQAQRDQEKAVPPEKAPEVPKPPQ